MGRRHILATKKKTESTDELSEEVVWDILKFAEGLGGTGIYGNALTPLMLNARMRDISQNPLQATENSLNDAMKDPKNSELQLMGFSEDFENTSQIYKKLISYLSDMPSWDITYSSTNAKFTDYKSPSYNKDLDIVKELLDNFDYKKEFRIAVRQMIRNEAFFCLPRFDTKKVVLQELPSSPTYTLITGRWEYGLLFDFNLYWFIQPGVDIDFYPNFFKEKYGNFLKGKNSGIYDPATVPELRGNTSWVWWQSLPPELSWVFKISPEIITRLPYYSGYFLDLVQMPLMRALQKNINMSTASRLILGEIGTLSRDAGAKLKDAFNISPSLLGQFLSLVKSAIGDSMKVAAAPMQNMQAVSFPYEGSLYQNFVRTSLSTTGVNSNLLFTSDVRPNVLESGLSLNTDEQFLYSLYPQFNAFLNYHVNRQTKKFKFNFEFEGTHFFNNRQMRLDNALKLATQGVVLPQKIAASIGMSPFTFQRQLEEARANGFVDNLTPIIPGANLAESETIGRPQKSESELSDGGSQTREDGGNIEKGGKI